MCICWDYFCPDPSITLPYINELSSSADRSCVSGMCLCHREQIQRWDVLWPGSSREVIMLMDGVMDLMQYLCWMWSTGRNFLYSMGWGDMFFILFASVPWWFGLWLDVVYGCWAVCGGLGIWKSAAPYSCCQGEIHSTLSWLLCRGFSPIHKNAIPCSSVPGLTK